MLDRVLIPHDGSHLAERLLMLISGPLLRLAREVVIVHALEPRQGTEEALARDVADAEQWLGHARRWIEALGPRTTSVVRRGCAATEILRCASDLRPSVIALSTHGRTGLGSWVRGSVAERVLRNAESPVFIANPAALESRWADGAPAFRRILVPLDGSDASAAVIPVIAELAVASGATVELLHVLTESDAAVAESAARDALSLAAGALGAARTSVTVARGVPAPTIVAAAERTGADLIALTTHGRSGVSRWLFGSVAEKLVHRASTALLVARPAGIHPRESS